MCPVPLLERVIRSNICGYVVGSLDVNRFVEIKGFRIEPTKHILVLQKDQQQPG